MVLNIKPKVKRSSQSFYVSSETRSRIKKMAKEMNLTQSTMLDALVDFGNGHIVNIKAWVEGMER